MPPDRQAADFVSLVSHELKGPMAAVIGAAHTLQDRWDGLAAEQRDSLLSIVVAETRRLAALVDDIADTSRLEAGTFSYRFEEVDLADLVARSVAASTLAQQEVAVVAHIPDALPPIRGDDARLRQVLGNLIDNAVKYSPEGGEVDVDVAIADEAVTVSVGDDGLGIPPEYHERIFEQFGRAAVPGSTKPGTGLGLFISRSIAEAHGGTLDVSSVPGKGAAFVLTLPLS